MSVIFCPSNDDEHGSFPHRLIIGQKFTFVICAICDHWTAVTQPECDCPVKCHDITQSDRELGVDFNPLNPVS